MIISSLLSIVGWTFNIGYLSNNQLNSMHSFSFNNFDYTDFYIGDNLLTYGDSKYTGVVSDRFSNADDPFYQGSNYAWLDIQVKDEATGIVHTYNNYFVVGVEMNGQGYLLYDLSFSDTLSSCIDNPLNIGISTFVVGWYSNEDERVMHISPMYDCQYGLNNQIFSNYEVSHDYSDYSRNFLGFQVNLLRGIVYSESFQEGYEVGLLDGQNQGYQSGYEGGYEYGLEEGQQTGYYQGYSAGYQDAENQDATTLTIFNGILSVGILPIQVFMAMLNWEVFGINIGSFVSATLSILMLVILFRFIFKSKVSD